MGCSSANRVPFVLGDIERKLRSEVCLYKDGPVVSYFTHVLLKIRHKKCYVKVGVGVRS
jgi:hypothetical protein